MEEKNTEILSKWFNESVIIAVQRNGVMRSNIVKGMYAYIQEYDMSYATRCLEIYANVLAIPEIQTFPECGLDRQTIINTIKTYPKRFQYKFALHVNNYKFDPVQLQLSYFSPDSEEEPGYIKGYNKTDIIVDYIIEIIFDAKFMENDGSFNRKMIF